MFLQVRTHLQAIVDPDARSQQNRGGMNRSRAHNHFTSPNLLTSRAAYSRRALSVEQDPIYQHIATHFQVHPSSDGIEICVVRGHAPAATQRQRILARDNMTADKLDAILARQLPDAEKRKRADFVVDTSHGLEPVRAAIKDILVKAATMPIRRTDQR